MKKFLVTSLALMFAITPFFSVNFAFAASANVDTNVSFSQGLTKGGDPISALRSDPSMALGVPDGNFVSLGYEGEIVLAFPTFIGGGALSITAFERTNGTYPLEQAEVFVSSDNSTWSLIGVANNLLEGDPSRPSLFELKDECIKYVKIIDTSDRGLHNSDDSDGYDLDAVGAEYTSECNLPDPDPEPCTGNCSSGDDIVINNNSAFVTNSISANSNTGGNTAGGSYGGEGGDAGDISSGDVEDSTTGNGGRGGDSRTGGTVYTGNAYSTVDLTNEINNNRTIVNRCACEADSCCDAGGQVMVFNRNRAIVMNNAEANANTGNNEAEGSYAGEGGDGGTIGGYESDSEVDDSSTGNGGIGGVGGAGGLVQTGESRSRVVVVNVINRTITRILR